MRASFQKRLIRLIHYTESRIVLKTGQYEKMFLHHVTASRRSVGLNYFQTGLRILFTIFFWTKTQLWKLMWAFLGCCIGNNISPVHSLMRWFIYTLHFAMAISLHDAMKIFINRPSIDNFSLMHVISSGLSFYVFFLLSFFYRGFCELNCLY